LLGIALVHETLLLVDQLDFEFLLSDLLKLHLACDLLLNAALLGFTATMPGLLLARILIQQRLVFFLLPRDSIHRLLIAFVLLRRLFGG